MLDISSLPQHEESKQHRLHRVHCRVVMAPRPLTKTRLQHKAALVAVVCCGALSALLQGAQEILAGLPTHAGEISTRAQPVVEPSFSSGTANPGGGFKLGCMKSQPQTKLVRKVLFPLVELITGLSSAVPINFKETAIESQQRTDWQAQSGTISVFLDPPNNSQIYLRFVPDFYIFLCCCFFS